MALVAVDGTIAWWCVPNLDSPPLFDCLYDSPSGSLFSLRPTEPFRAEHAYRRNSNVLETTYTTASGVVRVTDSMNSSLAGRLPWNELARRIEGVKGAVTVRFQLSRGGRSDIAVGPLQPDRNLALFHAGSVLGVVVASEHWKIVDGGDAGLLGEATLNAGDRAMLAIVAADNAPLGIPSIKQIDARIDLSDHAWRIWADELEYEGPHGDAVIRSALALKLLLFSPTGAIAAAATTSLPEKIGGKKNYDYRYAWVRDASYTLHAFLWLGLIPESHASFAWLLQHLGDEGARVCFGLSGGAVPKVKKTGHPGYRHSRPVVTGNAAGGQHQHGIYGDIFEAAVLFASRGNLLDQKSSEVLAALADECAERWREKDSGMWELEERRHYTMSKVSAWQALNRAVELAGSGCLPAKNVARWSRERDEITAWVNEHCWSEKLRAYTFYPGTERLDASLVLAVRFGFPERERLSSTCDTICRQLGHGPWIYRYSDVEEEEGAFLACTFWLAEAYATLGRKAEAAALIDQALQLLPEGSGILSEMIDVASGDFLGNLPQGLSHLALIHAVMSLQPRSD